MLEGILVADKTPFLVKMRNGVFFCICATDLKTIWNNNDDN